MGGYAWVEERESDIYTLVKTRSQRNLVGKYPNIKFTTNEGTGANSTQYPTVYIHAIEGSERAQDLENNVVNAFQFFFQIDVTCSKEQGRESTREVVSEVLDQFKKLRFTVRGKPIYDSETSIDVCYARVSRTLAQNDDVQV